MVYFISEREMQHAIDEEPWSIMDFCFNLKRWSEACVVEDVRFDTVCYWIQVHNLPLEILTNENAERIWGKLGPVIKMGDIFSKLRISKGSLRIRVEFSFENSLVDGFWVSR
ncbi:hypothetical protein REPUB_Repub09cG0144300 [Reevesia pubescens]